MKHMMPFILIALIVAGAMIFLQDDYEEPFRTDLKSEVEKNDWVAIFFINDIESEDASVGIKLDYNNEDTSPENIEALEFFVETKVGDFFFQDLEIEDFDGEMIYEERCESCIDQGLEDIYGTAIVNWRINDETMTEHFSFLVEMTSND